jgi:hypothetical protein
MAFTGGAVVVKMRDFSSKGSVGDVQEVVGVDVVRQRAVDLRDKHGDTRERCSLQQFGSIWGK